MAANPAPGTTRQVDIRLGDIDTRLTAELLLDASSDLDTQPVITHNRQGFAVTPYAVVRGLPVAEPKRGARIATKATLRSFQKVTAALDAKNLDLGAWKRWVPYAEFLEAPANGGRRWYPQNSPRDSNSPRISLTSVIPVGAGGILTGRGTFGPASPGIDEGYSYRGYARRYSRPAMVFDGAAAAIIEPVQTFSQVTFGMVAVFNASAGPYYGIFEASMGGRGEPLVYRYAHGRIDIFQNETRVLSHETHKSAQYPVVLLVSMDSATDTGRLFVIDKNRTTRTFNIANLDFVSMAGVIGALGQATAASPWRFASQMDVLEIDLWDRALTFPEMESAANLLCLAYGVVG